MSNYTDTDRLNKALAELHKLDDAAQAAGFGHYLEIAIENLEDRGVSEPQPHEAGDDERAAYFECLNLDLWSLLDTEGAV